MEQLELRNRRGARVSGDHPQRNLGTHFLWIEVRFRLYEGDDICCPFAEGVWNVRDNPSDGQSGLCRFPDRSLRLNSLFSASQEPDLPKALKILHQRDG